MKNRERGHILVVILGVVLMLFVLGFFRSEKSFWGVLNYKAILRLPCGLTVNNPKFDDGEKLSFPLVVDGYVNGCGWNMASGSAGTAQVFDAMGLPVTIPVTLAVPSDSTEMPYYFKATLVPNAAPHTDTGAIILRSSAGLLSSIPVAF
jgi:hypothetical protein